MSSQLSHTEHSSPVQKFPIVLLADNIMGEANLGSLFRLADAFNIDRILFCGTPVNMSSNRLKRTARATYKTVQHEQWENGREAYNTYTQKGYKPYALEITEDSVALENLHFREEDKILLVIGNENYGISQDLLDQITTKMHINMFGHNSSMNVAQATAIALYEITKTLPPLREK